MKQHQGEASGAVAGARPLLRKLRVFCVGVVLSAPVLMTSGAAAAGTNWNGDCLDPESCTSFPEFYRRTPRFQSAVQTEIRTLGLHLDWVPNGTSSAMTPISIEGQSVIAGAVCEPHWCTHRLGTLFYAVSGRMIGEYLDKKEQRVWIGTPTAIEREALAELRMNKLTAGRAFGKPPPVGSAADAGTAYVAALKQKYGPRLSFSSATARSVVERFNIDCRARDGRTLPLVNLLFGMLKEGDYPKLWLTLRADSRGQNVRVFDVAMSPQGPVREKLVLEVNEWGELQMHGGIRTEAVLNACFGSRGPIWTMPR